MASGDDDPNKYRDRADERRKGQNPDYADKLNQMASMDAETTKYLGGDVEHTHLVKGLDYALLVKIREEERQQQLEVCVGYWCVRMSMSMHCSCTFILLCVWRVFWFMCF